MQSKCSRKSVVEAFTQPFSLNTPHRSDAPPFTIFLAALAAYAASDPSSVPTAANKPSLYRGDTKIIDKALVRTISSMAVILALTYCRQHNRPLTPPKSGEPFIFNLLLMMGFVDGGTKFPNPIVVKSLERPWVLYCDHEMTKSTAAFLHVASTLADPISCCSAFIASGNGPLHAGAVDLAYKAYAKLGTPEKVPAMIADVKSKKYRLFGIWPSYLQDRGSKDKIHQNDAQRACRGESTEPIASHRA